MQSICATLCKELLVFLIVLTFSSPGWTAGRALFPNDTINKTRFYALTATGAVLYGSALFALNHTWYKNTERTSFHTFNDWNEWNNMDKFGHSFTAYFETELTYRGFRWTGVRPLPALWLSAGMGLLYQTTVEMFDGYSKKWGFSWYDTGFNVLGVSSFVVQQLLWEEQRIRWKVPSWPKEYSSKPIQSNPGESMSSLKQRTEDLFGSSKAEQYLERERINELLRCLGILGGALLLLTDK